MFVTGLLWALWWWVVAPVGSMARYGALRLTGRPARWEWGWPVGPTVYAVLLALGTCA